ncbi:hypothetical protein F4861DRAFT_517619 [Xylaria intraflava]|nr:hypothetical protein F4861DRAFT_517619 [Xylaria intraflava]
MADKSKPAPTKRALPFKRTARPKPPSDDAIADDDGIALFSQSKTFFPTVVEDQQKRAREKAEKERQEKIAREREEAERETRKQEEKDRRAVEAQLRREQKINILEEDRDFLKKRRRRSLLSDSDDDVGLGNRPRKTCKASTPLSPDSRSPHGPGSARSTRSTRSTRKFEMTETPVCLIDSSDDEGGIKKESKSSGTSPRQFNGGRSKAPHIDLRKDKAKVDDSDSDLAEILGADEEAEGEDPLQPYIKAAMERMRKAKEAQEASDANNTGTPTPGVDGGPTVRVMLVAPALPEVKPLCCTLRTSQALQIAFDTFKARQKVLNKLPHKVISSLVFTWRGDRVYNSTKLETLGIHPQTDNGLRDKTSDRDVPEGYLGKDQVYFEACTPEDYEESQKRRERERKRQEMGEWWSEDEGDADDNNAGADADARAKTPQEEADRVKVIFKARNMPARNVTLRKNSTVAQMIKAFRKLAGLGEDSQIEIRWDGEVLEPETTVEEADIGDMDSVEVHIR